VSGNTIRPRKISECIAVIPAQHLEIYQAIGWRLTDDQRRMVAAKLVNAGQGHPFANIANGNVKIADAAMQKAGISPQ
jgi:3-deoxy-D-arabino-heptulosonate 7-phosphate (DAHP) synthase